MRINRLKLWPAGGEQGFSSPGCPSGLFALGGWGERCLEYVQSSDVTQTLPATGGVSLPHRGGYPYLTVAYTCAWKGCSEGVTWSGCFFPGLGVSFGSIGNARPSDAGATSSPWHSLTDGETKTPAGSRLRLCPVRLGQPVAASLALSLPTSARLSVFPGAARGGCNGGYRGPAARVAHCPGAGRERGGWIPV